MQTKISKPLFWLLSCTWGFLMTFVGSIAALIMLITGHKAKKFGPYIYFEAGDSWGGVNFGPFFIVCNGAALSMKQHESGHGIQNIKFGPLFPFLIGIPSMIRWTYREILYRVDIDAYLKLPPYDSIWFEGNATKTGQKYFKKEDDKNCVSL